MQSIAELRRLPSPAPKPQSLAFDGTTLWMGSRETRRIYAIDPATWAARDEGEAPGTPWGMTVAGDEIFVVCSDNADDDRVIRTFIPGHGFSADKKIDCPGQTGSQLSYDGDRLYLSQWYNKRILSLDETGAVGTIIDLPHQICGQVVADAHFYAVTTDDESTGRYFLSRIDARTTPPRIDDIATIGFDARALAFDGTHFWTNHREANEIVCFARPDGA